MKKEEKIGFLQKNYMGEWLKAKTEAIDVVSKQCSMFCVCGKICTGFHESSCRRFQDKANSLAIKKLSHLLNKNA